MTSWRARDRWPGQRRCAQVAAGLLEEDQSAAQALVDRTTLAQARGGACVGTGLAAMQVLLDAIEMGDLAQDPFAALRGLLARFEEVAACVGPASRQGNLPRVVLEEAPVGHVGIALEGALEVSPRSHS
jgi:hypothetical protein